MDVIKKRLGKLTFRFKAQTSSPIHKLCRLDYVQLEDDIGYIKSSQADLSSTN